MGKPKRKILTFVDYYEPGFLAGGPITTLRNMVSQLGKQYEFHIVTRNHDLGKEDPYPEINSDEWQSIDSGKVIYLTKEKITYRHILNSYKEIMCQEQPDCLYLNSFMSRKFSIAPLIQYRKIYGHNAPVVLAPRGEFAPAALKIKSLPKNILVSICKKSEIWNGILWQASSQFEAKDIANALGKNRHIKIAPDMSAKVKPLRRGRKKIAGNAKLAFVGRLSKMKNISGLITILAKVKKPIELNIYGPIEDVTYWEHCQTKIIYLPNNITVKHHGIIEPTKIIEILSSSDGLLLPSLGENFGQVAIEAMSAGCPVIASDNTPWKDLDKNGCGMCIPLDQEPRWIKALESLSSMDEIEHRKMRQNAYDYAVSYSENDAIHRQNYGLFSTL